MSNNLLSLLSDRHGVVDAVEGHHCSSRRSSCHRFEPLAGGVVVFAWHHGVSNILIVSQNFRGGNLFTWHLGLCNILDDPEDDYKYKLIETYRALWLCAPFQATINLSRKNTWCNPLIPRSQHHNSTMQSVQCQSEQLTAIYHHDHVYNTVLHHHGACHSGFCNTLWP